MLEEFPEAAVAEVEDGWEDGWREFHRPVRIGRLWVGPPWEAPPADALTVVIDPGRAFGTGAHPSTRLCLELLLDEQPGSMLDIGCGSGVISIAAARLGFGPVTAIDIDEVAVEVTRENAVENGVEIETLPAADARGASLPQAGLAVANISLEAIEAVGARITAAALDHRRLPRPRPARAVPVPPRRTPRARRLGRRPLRARAVGRRTGVAGNAACVRFEP